MIWNANWPTVTQKTNRREKLLRKTYIHQSVFRTTTTKFVGIITQRIEREKRCGTFHMHDMTKHTKCRQQRAVYGAWFNHDILLFEMLLNIVYTPPFLRDCRAICHIKNFHILCRALKTNTTIKKLWIESTILSLESIQSLVEILKTNKYITYLKLGNLYFNDISGKDIWEALA